MFVTLGRVGRALALGAGLMTVGCGANASLSPLGPSAGGTAGGTIAGAVITGVVTGATGSPMNLSGMRTLGTAATSPTISVSVSGTNIASSTDGQGRFALTGVPAGNVDLTFTGPGANATVTIAGVTPSDRIEITVSVNGQHGRVDSEHRRKDNNRVEVNGRITAVDATARTLRVGTAQVSVPATAIIRHGSRVLTFADLVVGVHVEVKGKLEGAVYVADEVKVEQSDDDGDDDNDDDDDVNDVKLEGAVSALAGTCQVISFTVAGTSVTTTVTTNFHKVLCSAIANSTVVEVKGIRQAGGSVVASRVSLEEEDD